MQDAASPGPPPDGASPSGPPGEADRELRLDALTVELLECLERGQNGRIDDLLKLNPDLRLELEAFVEGQRRLINAEKKAGLVAHHGAARSQAFPRPFGNHDLLEEIARGGMGVVYKAREQELGRLVALKVVAAAHMASPADLARFKLGAEAAALLDHPNIVPIYSIGWEDGQPYFTMRLVVGSNLAHALGSFSGKPREAASLVEIVARAVQHAHEHGVLHRDLKPANILLDDARKPFVTDFGLAKILGRPDGVTLTGSLLGTRSYMAPELLSGKKDALTTACDVYSLAVVLYELLCGKPPFQDESPLRELTRASEEDARFPAAVKCARDLKTICLKGLSRNPQQRYESALELANDLRRYLEGRPIRARPVAGLERVSKWMARRPGTTVLAVVTLATVAFNLGSWIQHTREIARQNADLQSTTAELKSRERLNQRLFYAVKSSLAGEATEKQELRHARMLLRDLMPAPGRPDLRSFEWRFLFRLCHAAESWIPRSEGAWSVALSGDGTLLAAGIRSDGSFLCPTAKLNDPSARLKIPHRRANAIRGMAFVRSAKELVLLQSEGSLEIWPVEEQRLGAEPFVLARDATRFGLSPEGEWLTLTTKEGAVEVWNLADRKIAGNFKPPENRVNLVATGPGGACVLSADVEGLLTLRERNGETWTTRPLGAGAVASCACFTPDGRQVVTGHMDGRLFVWDLSSGKPMVTSLKHSHGVMASLLSPDGKLFFSSGDDSTLKVWDTSTWQLRATIRFPSRPVTTMAYSQVSERLVAGSSREGLFEWSAKRLESPQTLTEPASLGVEPDSVERIHFLDGSKRFLTIGNDFDVKLLDLVQGPFGSEAELRHHFWWPKNGYRFGTVSPNARWAASGQERSSSGHGVRLWKLPDPLPLDAAIEGDGIELDGNRGQVNAVAFSKDSRRLAVAGVDGDLKLWRLGAGPTGEEEWKLEASMDLHIETMILEHSPDGKTLAAATWRKLNLQIVIIDMETKGMRALLDTGDERVSAATFSPDSSVLVTGSPSGDLKVWNLRGVVGGTTIDRRPQDSLRTHVGAVKALAFSPDGRRLASGSMGGELKIWDFAGSESPDDLLECLSLPAQEGGVKSLSFSLDGQTLVSGGFAADKKKGEILLWRAPDPDDMARWGWPRGLAAPSPR